MKVKEVKVIKEVNKMMVGDDNRLYQVIHGSLCRFNGNGFFVVEGIKLIK